jgi:RHS repeat-associated protein
MNSRHSTMEDSMKTRTGVRVLPARYLLAVLLMALLTLGAAPFAPAWLVAPAVAHDFGGNSDPDDEDDDPDDDPPCQQCPCDEGSAGNPIFLLDGAERPTLTDLVTGDLYPIRVVRHYDSQSTYDSPLGYGWAFNHDRRLFEYPDGSVLMRTKCGSRDVFEFTGGAYVTPPDAMRGQLTEQADGTFAFRYYDGTADEYDAEGRLVAEIAADGSRHELLYADADGDGRPDKYPLIGTSPRAVDPDAPMVVAYVYRVTRIQERAADGALTGRQIDFAYDDATGRLASATADDGRSIGYAHDEYAGATRGNLVEVRGLEGIVSTYGYEDWLDQDAGTLRDAHNLTHMQHAQNETVIVNTYDAQDRVIRQTRGLKVLTFNYSNPRIQVPVTETIAAPDGSVLHTATTTYNYDSDGFITRITDALGHQTRYSYNSAKRRTRVEHWDRSSGSLVLRSATDYAYNAQGDRIRATTVLSADESLIQSWRYDQGWVVCEQRVSTAHPGDLFRSVYQLGYDGDGVPVNIQSVSRLVSATTANDTDGDGLLTCNDGVSGDWQTTQYSYDAKQRLTATTLPDGVQVINEYADDSLQVTATYFRGTDGTDLPQLAQTFGYDDQGNLSDLWDAKGNHTQTTYDAKGRITSVTNALGEQTLYTYTADNLAQIEVGRTAADGEGQVTKFIYDGDNNLIEIQRKDDTGTFLTFETYSYDSAGNRLSVTDAENRTTGFGYDALGRLISTTDALGNTTAFTYDSAGNLTKTTDALLRETRHIYDPLDRLIRTEQAGIDPPAITRMAYDAAGNVVAVTDANNNTTSFTYDGLSRQLTETKPLGQTLTYVYDSRDRLDYRLNARGHRIDYSYAPWGPVTREEVYNPDNTTGVPDETITYAYDRNGNLAETAYDAVQPLTEPLYLITYDALDREDVRTVGYIPNITVTLDNDYDRYGNRTALNVNDGESLVHSYDFDKLNRLTQATVPGSQTFSFDYYTNDQRRTIYYPSGVTSASSYFANGPAADISIRNGASLALEQIAYTYDPVGNVDTQSDGDGLHDYFYDGLDRLTEAVHPTGVGLPAQELFVYDKVGNRHDPTDPDLYGYDANNRILQSPDLVYSFDDDGSQTGRSDGASFAYNAYNRLLAYSKDGISAAYVYSPMGQRLTKNDDTLTTYFLWDGQRLIGEYAASGNRMQRYAYLPGDYAPVQIADANGVYDVHRDHQQTPRLLTDAMQQTVWRSRFEAYGKAVVDDDADGDGAAITYNQRFPGQYFDQESGLHYNYKRDYDPAIGRYIQTDPIGLDGGTNTYGYVHGNPITFSDPTGEIAPAAVAIRLAIAAAWRGLQRAIQRCAGNPACRCRAFNAAYHALQAIGCNACNSPGTVCCAITTAQAGAMGGVVTLRAAYIASNCDRHLPGRRDHHRQLTQAQRALARCSAKAARMCRGCF